jgi:hypothetical protein
MSKIDEVGSFGAPLSYRVSGLDTLRIKAFNSWPQTEQVVTTDPLRSVAGPENFQFKLVVKFVRLSDPTAIVTCTKIGTMDNDRALNGVASGGIIALPFGVAANKQRQVTDANCTFNSKSITAFSIANPTQVTTGTPHGLTTGDLVLISGSTSTPNADGLWYVQNASGSTFNIALNVSITGTGTVVTSRTLTSATAAFTVGDVGKNITLSIGGQTGNQDGTWGTGQPWAGTTPTSPAQGPKFPIRAPNVTYDGVIIGFTNSTTVTVKPSLVVNPNGAGVLKIDPIMLGDQDGNELGDGWVVGVDINYWQGTPKPGQSMFECEINRGVFNMHEGISLIPKSYLETSGHLSWPYGRPGPTNSLSGHGYTRTVTIANPGAGNDWTITVPTNAHWKLIGIRATLAAVGAANRNPLLLFDDGSANVWNSPIASTAQVAATTVSYSWGFGLTEKSITPAAGNIQASISLTGLAEFQEGGRIRSSTPGIQAGDTWTNINALVEEWICE